MSTLLNMRVKQCEFDELLLKQTTIFFRIKRQTYTRPLKTRLYILIINKIKACMCLAFNSKKITPVISTLQIKVLNIWLFYAFVMPSLQVRYTSVTEPFQIRSLE